MVSLSARAAILPVESSKTMGPGSGNFSTLADCAHAAPLPATVTATTTATISIFTSMPPAVRLAALRSKLYGWSLPSIVSRTRASKRPIGAAPTFTGISPRTSPPNVQQPLALRIEVEESQHVTTLRRARRMIAANELVVRHAAVGQRHRVPRLDAHTRSKREAWSEHDGVQQIAFQADVTRHRAIIERTRQRRNEVDMPRRTALQKTAARNFNHHIYVGRLEHTGQ